VYMFSEFSCTLCLSWACKKSCWSSIFLSYLVQQFSHYILFWSWKLLPVYIVHKWLFGRFIDLREAMTFGSELLGDFTDNWLGVGFPICYGNVGFCHGPLVTQNYLLKFTRRWCHLNYLSCLLTRDAKRIWWLEFIFLKFVKILLLKQYVG